MTDVSSTSRGRRDQCVRVHAEIFFDPQAHTQRGIAFQTVIDGLRHACHQSQTKFGISSHLIMCFLRDLSVQSAMETLAHATRYGEDIIAVRLDSAEQGHPPSKFRAVFDKARAEGFLAVCHAGEEGPPAYVWEAIKLLQVSRLDHGVRSMEDPALVAYLARTQLPLTVCPLSNVKLGVFPDLKHHNVQQMLAAGLRVTVNSDDPAYFGGYVGENFLALQDALHLTEAQLVALARNTLLAAFLPKGERQHHLATLEAAYAQHQTASISPQSGSNTGTRKS
jgi:adenosine deaminase